MDVTGRRTAIIVAAVVYTVGGALQTGAVYLWYSFIQSYRGIVLILLLYIIFRMLYLGRFITGFGVG